MLSLFTLFVFYDSDIRVLITCFFANFFLFYYSSLSLLTFGCHFFFFEFPFHFFFAVMLVLKFELTLLINLLEFVLQQLQSFKDSCLGMVLIQYLYHFLLILLGHTFV